VVLSRGHLAKVDTQKLDTALLYTCRWSGQMIIDVVIRLSLLYWHLITLGHVRGQEDEVGEAKGAVVEAE
jgi:hypothetical protein